MLCSFPTLKIAYFPLFSERDKIKYTILLWLDKDFILSCYY